MNDFRTFQSSYNLVLDNLSKEEIFKTKPKKKKKRERNKEFAASAMKFPFSITIN